MAERLPDPPVVIGLLGGIAAGKSTVARMLEEQGLVRANADAEAHAVLDEPEVRDRVVDRFGREALADDGRVDRRALAARVFADAEARADLERLVHPRVRQRLLARIAAARAAGRSVVLDVPLLLEAGLIEACDACIWLEAGADVRRARARERGWSDGELERREAAQADLADKRARCRFTVDTGRADLDAVRRQLRRILDQLVGV